MTTPDATRDFVSIGALAAHLQKSVRTIELAATSLQLEPALRLNGIVHFDAEQVEMLIQAIVQLESRRNPIQQQADRLQ
jgi:hypothetical protein